MSVRAIDSIDDNEPIELRVVVVDDSALVRQTVSAILRDMPGVKVVGKAANGQEAIQQIQQFAPDLITLDVEMPVMNGIETLREMKRLRLNTRAVMLSSLTLAGAQVTLEALFEGAFDFIAKPTGGLLRSRDTLQVALLEKIAAFRLYRHSRRFAKNHRLGPAQAPNRLAPDNLPPGAASDEELRETFRSALSFVPAISNRCDVVLIGLSTGGPQALRHVIPRLEADFPVPIVLVQHMPATYTDTMARRLDEISQISVREGVQGDALEPGSVLVAPGSRHMKIVRRGGSAVVQLTDDPAEHGCRPSVDYTLRSIVDIFGGRALTVIMTGMGKDGLEGCRLLKQNGGTLFAQDEETSAVYGMPKAVYDAGLVDRVLPLGKIAPAIMRHVHRSRTIPTTE